LPYNPLSEFTPARLTAELRRQSVHRDGGALAEPSVIPATYGPAPTRVAQARRAVEACSRLYAEECVSAAFDLIRQTYPAAATLLVNTDHDDDGDTLMVLVAVRLVDETLAWTLDVYAHHPHAQGRRTELDLDGDVRADVEELLRTGYDLPTRSSFDPAGTGDYEGLPQQRSWTLLTVTVPAAAHGAERFVVVEGPTDDVYRFGLNRDDSVLMYVDGMPLVGVLGDDGAGWWPDGDGQDWHPLTPGTAVTSRRLHVLSMSEAQFHGVSHRLRLPTAHLGRFTGAQGELRAVTLDDGPWSCGDLFDAAVAYVQEQGLAYNLIVETTYESRPTS
jgi:hypothetical protein